MNELLIERLKSARTDKGLKQQDVAEQLGIKANTISNWEKGRTEPDIDTFVKLCDIYEIDCASLLSDVYAFKRISNDISLSEYNLIKKYRDLDDHGQETVSYILDRELKRTQQLEKTAAETQRSNIRIIQYYQKLASAGNGQVIFEDMAVDRIEIPDIPEYKRVSYAIGVNGKSMEPLYYDGDILLVEPTCQIDIGEIGVFIVGNNAYVKKLGESELISLNKGHRNIPLTEDSKCMGRVVDTLTV